MSLVISSSARFRFGITEPGFWDGGLRSHFLRLLGFMSKMAPAKTERLCR